MRGWPATETGMGLGIRAALVCLTVTGWAGLLFYQVLSRLAIYMPAGGLAGIFFRFLTAAGEMAQGVAFYLCLLVLLLLFLEERKGWRWHAGVPAMTRSTLWGLLAALAALSVYGGLRPFGLPLLVTYDALGLAVMVFFSQVQFRSVGGKLRACSGQEPALPAASSGKVVQLVSGFELQPRSPEYPWQRTQWGRLTGLTFSLAWGLAFMTGLLHSGGRLWGWSLETEAATSWAAGQVAVLAGGGLLLLASLSGSLAPRSGWQRWAAATLAFSATILFAMVYLAWPELVAILVNWSLGLSLRLPLTVYLLSLAGYLYALLTLFLSDGTRCQAALVLALLPVAGYAMPLAFNTLAATICLLLWEA